MPVNLGVGDVLAESGDLTVRRLSRASTWQKTHGGTIERALLSTGAVSEEILTSALAQAYGLPGISRAALLSADPDIVECLPAKERRRFRAFPFSLSGKILIVAISDPQNIVLQKNLAIATGFSVELFVAPDPVLEDVIERFEGRPAGHAPSPGAAAPIPPAAPAAPPPPDRGLDRPPRPRAPRRGPALRRDRARARSRHARRVPPHVRHGASRRDASPLGRAPRAARRVVPVALPPCGGLRRRGEPRRRASRSAAASTSSRPTRTACA